MANLRVYLYKCRTHGEFESDRMSGVACPECGVPAIRVFVSTPHFRPTANKRIGKKRKGTGA